MPGSVSQHFASMIRRGDLDPCIADLEERLRRTKPSEFRAVLGQDFLEQTKATADYLIRFFRAASKEIAVAVLYFEMNEFSINPKTWYFSGCAYSVERDGQGSEWIGEPEVVAHEDFTLEGMQPVRNAFRELMAVEEDPPRALRSAAEIAEHLVVARYMQLIAAAHQVAKKKLRSLDGLPVLSTAHERDVFHRTT